MNQLERDYKRRSSSSRSTGGSSRGSYGASRSRASASSRSRARGSQSSRAQGGSGRRSSGRYRKNGPDYGKIAIVGVVLLILIACVVFIVRLSGKDRSDEAVQETTLEAEMEQEVTVDGVTITGMSMEQAKAAILEKYPWGMTVVYGDETYEVSDLLEEKVDALLTEIYAGEPEASYTLDTSGLDEAVAREAEAAAALWDKSPKNGSIESFDAESGSFVFAEGETGLEVDQEKLAADISAALESKDFDAQIQASVSEVQPEITKASAKELYKTISTFTTTTTANSNRNTNIRLAAQALNGTIVGPWQEFSFNQTVGQRTEAKGYKGAAAYNNGEVVQEIGGGVCQVSTTLYNAVFRAGLNISFRRSHTFEPTYITPGQDATVSWEQPDFKFVNNSSTAIGIRASYSNQKVTVSIYGIPLLEDGVKWDLESVKVEDVPAPAPTYVEDQTLEPGVEVQDSAGSTGSRWEVYKIVTKDGEEVSRERDHTVTYKGHAPVIRRNTSGVVLRPDETTTGTETAPSTIDGMPEGYVPGDPLPTDDSTTAAAGPGGETTAAAGPAGDSQAAPTAAQTTAAVVPAGPGETASTSAQEVIAPISPNPGG